MLFNRTKLELGVREASHGMQLASLSVYMSFFLDGMDFMEASIISILIPQKFF